MADRTPTVFIIDDDESVCDALVKLMSSAGYRVMAFHSSREFLAHPREDRPDCLLLDVRMPGISGLALQKRLNSRDEVPSIVFMTGYGNIPMAVQAIKAGAVDFLQKPFKAAAVLNAVSRAIDEDAEHRAQRLALSDTKRRLSRLTPREYEVLRYVISGRLNKQIAYELGIKEQTVKVHRGRVMAKMEVPSVAELVRLTESAGVEPA